MRRSGRSSRSSVSPTTTRRSPLRTTRTSASRRPSTPTSLQRAFRYLDNLRVGNVVVNDSTDYWEAHEPFGGAAGTRTGWGRIGGRYTMLDMTDLKTAVLDVGCLSSPWPFAVLFALAALDSAGYSIIAPVVPEIGDATGAGPGLMGALVASFAVGQMVGYPLAARVLQRRHALAVLFVSLALVIVGDLGFIFGESLGVYFPGQARAGNRRGRALDRNGVCDHRAVSRRGVQAADGHPRRLRARSDRGPGDRRNRRDQHAVRHPPRARDGADPGARGGSALPRTRPSSARTGPRSGLRASGLPRPGSSWWR